MGFIIFTATSIAFSIAAVVSMIAGAVGIFLHIRRGKGSPQAGRAFWICLIGTLSIGLVLINVVPFPQGPGGSNYVEWMNEWLLKAVVYALLPGLACLLGGAASAVFAPPKPAQNQVYE